MSFDTGQLVKVFDLPDGANRAVIPDEKTVIYNAKKSDVDNLWSQPIDGGEPKQLTKSRPRQSSTSGARATANSSRSPRGTSSSDIILIKDFQ